MGEMGSSERERGSRSQKALLPRPLLAAVLSRGRISEIPQLLLAIACNEVYVSLRGAECSQHRAGLETLLPSISSRLVMGLNWAFVLEDSVKRDKEGPGVSPPSAWEEQKKEAHLSLLPFLMHRNAVFRTSFNENLERKKGLLQRPACLHPH